MAGQTDYVTTALPVFGAGDINAVAKGFDEEQQTWRTF